MTGSDNGTPFASPNALFNLSKLAAYMDLGSMRTQLGPISGTIPGEVPIDVNASGTARTEFTDQIVRVGLSYKFGEAGYAPLK